MGRAFYGTIVGFMQNIELYPAEVLRIGFQLFLPNKAGLCFHVTYSLSATSSGHEVVNISSVLSNSYNNVSLKKLWYICVDA